MNKFDLLILGSGPAGDKMAKTAAAAGKSVAVIDQLFGGTCALKGCTPKKAMESVTSVYWEARHAQGKGFDNNISPVQWRTLMAHKAKFTTLVPGGTKKKYKRLGVTSIEGYGSFKDEKTILVRNKEYTARHIIIATGAKPTPLSFPGADHMITSYDFFELDQLPKKVAIVGGGYIGFELSHIIAACGSEVTILSKDEQPLSAFDSDHVDTLVKATLDKGIEVKLGFAVSEIATEKNGFNITTKRADNKTFTHQADLVIHAAGRVPNTDLLKLDQAGISLSKNKGIAVNDFLQVKGHDHIYALGDVTGKLQFTEVANYEATVVYHNLYSKRRRKVSYHGLPAVVYTYPRLAMVGKKSVDDKDKYIVRNEDAANHFIQRAKSNPHARFKTIVDKKSKKIIGATLLGYKAEEGINLIAMAMQLDMDYDKIKDLLLAYPTMGNTIKGLF